MDLLIESLRLCFVKFNLVLCDLLVALHALVEGEKSGHPDREGEHRHHEDKQHLEDVLQHLTQRQLHRPQNLADLE